MFGTNPLPAPSSRYWNEHLETTPPDQLDAYHLKRIEAILKCAYEYSPFYRRHYDRAGVKPQDIPSLDDLLHKSPAIDKPDLTAAQAVNPPYDDLLAQTGGTSEHYEMRVGRDRGLDQLLVKVEAHKSLAGSAYAVTVPKAREILKDKIRIGIPMEVLPPGSLPRYEFKARRFFDHSKTGNTPAPVPSRTTGGN